MIFLLVALIFAFICWRMAHNRGRNEVVGFVLGLFFGFFTVIGYWIAGDTEAKKQERVDKAVAKLK